MIPGAAVLLTAALGRPCAAAEPPDPKAVLDVFQQELDRNMGRLRLEGFGPPYFLSYRMTAQKASSARAYFGEISHREDEEHNILYVGARYGDPKIDNVDGDYNGPAGYAPVDSDPDALRQQLWQLTDDAYKKALEGYLAKKARLAQEYEGEILPDFSFSPPQRRASPPAREPFNRKEIEEQLRRASAVFRRYAGLTDGEASVDYTWSARYLVNSEGARLAFEGEHLPVDVYVGAKARAADGMGLEQFDSFSVRSLKDLRSRDLEASAERIARSLAALAQAPVQSPVTAPAIFDPEFAGVFFHEALGHKLEGERQRDAEESQVFRGRLGQQVMPSFLSLIDDPSLESFQGTPLNGYYPFDTEGTPSRRVVLINHGVLRGFLMARRPVPGFDLSNGHGRSDAAHQPIGRMGNLIVEAHQSLPLAELKARLIKEAQRRGLPYGFWIKGAVSGDNPTQKKAPQTLRVKPKLVYRVDAQTGAETLVRGVELVGTPLVIVNRILAAGDDPGLDNSGGCGAASGWVPVSEISPSLLVSEIELERLPEERARPPILPSPLHDR